MSKQFNVISGSDTNIDNYLIDGLSGVSQDDLPLSLNVSAARNWSHITVADGDNWRDSIATDDALLICDTAGIIKRSLNLGLTWIDPTTPIALADSLNALAYDKKNKITLCCSGNGNIFRSLDDGDTWATVNLGAISTFLGDIEFSNGIFIAVGGTNIIFSVDGSDNSWTEAVHPAPPGLDTFREVAFGNGRWLVVGGGSDTFAMSSDDNGKNWSSETELSTSGSFSEIIFVKNSYFPNGSFFATKSNGDYLSTQNGESWILLNNFGGGDTNTIFYSGGQWLIGGGGTSIRTSWDSKNWVEFNPTPSTELVSSFSFKQNVFIATSATNNGDIYRSTLPTSNTGDIYANDGESETSVKPVRSELLLSARRTTDFNFDGLPQNTPASIPLDAGTYDSEDVSIAAADGLITFKTISIYEVKIMFVYGRDLTTSQALLMCGLEYDGVAVVADDVRLCAKQDADDTWNIDNGTIKIQTTSINQTIRMMLWTDSADEDTILLKAAFSNYQSVNTPALVYQIWKVY